MKGNNCTRQSRWLCSLRRRSVATWLPGAWVWILLRAWIFFSCVFCVLCGQQPLQADCLLRWVLPAVCVCQIVCDLGTSTINQLYKFWQGLFLIFHHYVTNTFNLTQINYFYKHFSMAHAPGSEAQSSNWLRIPPVL